MKVSEQVNWTKVQERILEEAQRANELHSESNDLKRESIKEQKLTNKLLKAIDKRQSKNDKVNFPMIFIGAVASYFAIHAILFGAEDLKKTLISGFDWLMRPFL